MGQKCIFPCNYIELVLIIFWIFENLSTGIQKIVRINKLKRETLVLSNVAFILFFSDNLYEPVNPPPLYGNDSYLSKDLQQVPQMEDKMIEIPPEIEVRRILLVK